MLLTALLRSYNEEENIERCLDNLFWFCDQVVISDGGSTDRTKELALSYNGWGSKYDWEWVVWLDYPGGSVSTEGHWNHTADQLNFALPHCNGEWIILQDVDQVYCRRVVKHLREELETTTADAYVMYSIHFLGDTDHYIEELGVGPSIKRLWRHSPELRFEGAVHASHMGHVNWKDPRVFRGARFHYGYMDPEAQQSKVAERHRALPHDPVYSRNVSVPRTRTPVSIPWHRCDPDCIDCWMEDV